MDMIILEKSLLNTIFIGTLKSIDTRVSYDSKQTFSALNNDKYQGSYGKLFLFRYLNSSIRQLCYA